MIGLVIILYLITVALIRMKFAAIGADIVEVAKVANDDFMPATLRQEARMALVGAQIVTIVWGGVLLLATAITAGLLVYLW